MSSPANSQDIPIQDDEDDESHQEFEDEDRHVSIADMIRIMARIVRKKSRITRRFLENSIHPCHLPDQTFRKLFGLPSELVPELIRMIAPHITSEAFNVREEVPVFMQVLCCLNFLTTGKFHIPRNIGVFWKISEPQVIGFVKRITRIISKNVSVEIVRFPWDHQQIRKIQDGFMESLQMPGIIGVINRFHVSIVEPSSRARCYKNRAGYYSIFAQMICDSDSRIISCHSISGGAQQESQIFDVNLLRAGSYHRSNPQSWLLGDRIWVCGRYSSLVVPFRKPHNDAERRFNELHGRAMEKMDKCWAMMRGQWKCLANDQPLEFSPEEAGHIIQCVSVCHNLLLSNGIPSRQADLSDPSQPSIWQRNRRVNNEGRQFLMRYISDHNI